MLDLHARPVSRERSMVADRAAPGVAAAEHHEHLTRAVATAPLRRARKTRTGFGLMMLA
jgi:hypothetical protein